MTPVYVKSSILCGSVNHYYHHLLDYVFPVWLEFETHPVYMLAKHDVTGLLSAHMNFWFRGRLTTQEPKDCIMVREVNPHYFIWIAQQLQAFWVAMQNQAKCQPLPEDVIYDKRLENHPYYKLVKQTSGSDRRYLVQEGELLSLLSRVFADKLKIVSFENMSVDEQVGVSFKAAVLIGAHGAGLANMLFTPPVATVIEVTFDNASLCFERLAANLGRRYIAIEAPSVHVQGRRGLVPDPQQIVSAAVLSYDLQTARGTRKQSTRPARP